MTAFQFLSRAFGLLLCLTALACGADTKDKSPKVRFAVNTPGAAPYLYYDENSKRYEGIVVDFFNSGELLNQFQVIYLDSNRTRSEEHQR